MAGGKWGDFSRRFYNEWHRCVRKSFPFFQKLGVHVLPNHFYNPIPDTRDLTDEFFARRSELVGIAMRDGQQLELLAGFINKFKDEYEAFPLEPTGVAHEYYVNNRTFEQVDGEILYCMIRQFTPRKIIEIGSGFSTYLNAQALQRNCRDGRECELSSIEPYPNKVLEQGFPGLTRLVKKRVEDVSLDEFAALQENDILFIDSSHVLKAGSDVQYEYLEILPRLNKGVIVHVHDIFMPAEYPRSWMMDHLRFWNEQYLLQAFLTFNESFEVLWAANYLRLTYPARLKEAFSRYSDSIRPGSFWMRRTK
jgi:predicted O-methyltransferase YrrM